ncbi:MAG TPA: transcriptional repressor LexA [Verrucomicrobiae bacterium]|nr:transcriptional repressor LexA [Verrucomicrobiae bacterium]
MAEPTKKQREILRFIRQKQERESVTPTYREIAREFGFGSVNAALAHVQALITKGFLTRQPGLARSLRVVLPTRSTPRPQVVPIPIYGSIPAGLPQDSTQEEEGCVLIDINTIGIKPTSRTFGLKVRGDSMIGKSILDGDIAVIEHGVEPRSGDVVAALIDGEVTLKTFVLQRSRAYLRAENPKYRDLIPRAELQIQGVMVALIRQRASFGNPRG